MAKEFSVGADVFALARRLLMSLPGMIVHEAQQSPPVNSLAISGDADEAAPASAFAQLLNLFLPPPPTANMPQRAAGDLTASPEPAMLPAAPQLPAIDPANLDVAQTNQLDEKSLSVSDLPELPTSAPSGLTTAEPFATTQTLALPVIETSQNALNPAPSPATESGQSPNAGDTPPVTMARRPRRNEEPPANDLAETGLAGTPQITFTQSPIGVSPPAMFEASAYSELVIDAPQSAAPLSESSGRHANATSAAMENQSMERLNQAGNDLLSQHPADLPTAATQSPAAPDDPNGFTAVQILTEDHTSMAANDLSSSDATKTPKQSDGIRRLPFTERPLEIELDPIPVTPGAVDAVSQMRDSDKNQDGVVAVSRGGAPSGSKDGWEHESHRSDPPLNPPILVSGTLARGDEIRKAEESAIPWRPVVERVAREIVDHLRVGKQAALLQLDPPELGKIKIDLRIEDGKLHASIVAAGQESQGLIESHLPELRQALLAGQIDVGELRVSQGEWHGNGALAQDFHQSPQGRQEAPRGFASSGLGDEAMAEHPAQPLRSADGRVSMWA